MPMVHDTCSTPPGIFNAQVGEAAALFIRADTFSTRSIQQSNPYPCASNILCCELVATIPLSEEKNDILVIAGLTNAQAEGGLLSVFAASGSSDSLDFLQSSGGKDATPSAGVWDAAQASLQVHIRCRLEAGHRLRFCFNVLNPRAAQAAAAPTIKLLGGNSLDLLAADVVLALPAYQMSDSHPMFVRAPMFKVLQAQQTSPFPCDAANTITIDFSVNIDMYPTCNILLTCTGFTSSLTDDNAMLPATLSDGNSTSASSDSHASWQKSSGTIVFNLTQASSAFVSGRLHDTTLYHVSFDLKNFNAQQTASAISCSTGTADVSIPQTPLSVCGQEVPDKVEGLADKVCSQLNSALCTKQDGCPLEVNEPTFLIHSIGKSTPEPGAGNKLCVTLAVNTADFIAGSEIVLEGFGKGFANTGMTIDAANTGMTIGAPYLLGFGGSGHGSDGIDCDMTSSNDARYIMFSRRNVRERWNTNIVSKFNADHLVCLKQTTTAQWQYYGVNAWQDLTQEAGDLVVTTITKENSLSAWVFTNPKVSTVLQSMPQGSDVCVSTSRGRCTDLVVSLFDIAKNALHCPNHHALKVSGDFVMPLGVILEGEHADHFDGTATSGNNPTLTLTVKTGHQLILGDDYHVCFYVQNPMHAAASYAISVSTNSCANIAKTAMVQTTDPLFVSEKKFVASAHQSSPAPCSTNKIILLFKASFDVYSSGVITLHGLGSIYPDPTIPIADAFGGYDHSQLFIRADDSACGDDSNEHDLCPSTGEWTSTSASRFLKLTVSGDKNLVAGETYAIAFDVENPHVIGSSPSRLSLSITATFANYLDRRA